MSVIHLSPAERIILINQFDLLKIAAPQEKKYYEAKQNALRSGFDTEHEGFTLRSHAGEDEHPDHRFVHDVLNMFRAVSDYIRKHPTDVEVANHSHAKFMGFDGNHEGEMRRFVIHLIDHEELYIEQCGRKKETDDFNSHSPMSDEYGRMLKIWKDAGGDFKLPRDTITAMLTAATSY